MVQFHATTICAVRRGPDDVCIGGDGQVTMGEHTIMKNGAKKVRKIYKNTVVTGFAGSVADAFALTEKFEKKLEEHGGNLKKAAVDLAQIWRSDKGMRSLEALMIVADKDSMLVISGNGEVIEPDQQFVAIGSPTPQPTRCSITPIWTQKPSCANLCASRAPSVFTRTAIFP